jgi:Flp pilus assembly protein TadD
MANRPEVARAPRHQLLGKLLTSTAIICIAAACSPISGKRTAQKTLPAPNFEQKSVNKKTNLTNPLHVATTYWANEYRKDPTNAKAALSYATNLKAIGAKEKALSILEQAHRQHPDNPDIASAYGRLALAKGQAKHALRILEKAEANSKKPDWKVLSAKGTAHAKLGNHSLAQQYYLEALEQNPKSPTLLNNLALSYAMSGKADEAEPLLRKVIKSGHDTPRVRQNLALVLGLQQKYDEGQQLASVDLPRQRASSNMDYLRSMRQNSPVTTASIEPANDARAEETKPATTEKKATAKSSKVAVHEFKWPSENKDTARPILSSATMPLPWAGPAEPSDTKKANRSAATKTVPLPEPKPKPATKPKRTAAAKTVPLPEPNPRRPRKAGNGQPAAPSQSGGGNSPSKAPVLPWHLPGEPSQEAAAKNPRQLTYLERRRGVSRGSSWTSSVHRQ